MPQKQNYLIKKVFGTHNTSYGVEKKQVTIPEPFNITDFKKAPNLSESLGIKLADVSCVDATPW